MFKIDFQEGGFCGHPGFLIKTILAVYNLRVAVILFIKFWASWPFCSGVEAPNRFSRQPSWISDQKDFSYFWSASCSDTSYQVFASTTSGDEVHTRFLRWWSSLISDQNDVSYFWSTSHPDTSYQVSSPCISREENQNRFSSWRPSWISKWNDFSYFGRITLATFL